MKKTVVFLILCIGLLIPSNCFAYFADTILDYSGGTGLDFTGDAHIPRVLGPWDLVFLSLGETGYITVGFDSLFVADEIGNDLRIYTTGHSIANEHAEISASKDGINFFSMGILDQNRASTWVGSGPNYQIFYVEFDLNNSGLDFARYIRVSDLTSGFVSTDLDAVEILNSSPIPEPATMLLLGPALLGLLGYKRKKGGVA